MFSLAKITKFIGTILMVLILFGFFSMIGTVVFEVIVLLGIITLQWFGIPLNPSSHTIDVASVLLSMTTVGIILYHIDRNERRGNAVKAENEAETSKNKPATERNVNKTVRMEIVSKKEIITQQGTITRELMFKDATGRVIEYNTHHQPNINTVFFAIEEGKSYDIEWHFYEYDETGKSSRYDQILKIDCKDVDLNK